jgi:hypothetical protein
MYLPTMIVFDLDDCLWYPEMHELYSKPTRPVQGILNPHVLLTTDQDEQTQKDDTTTTTNINIPAAASAGGGVVVTGVVGLANDHGDIVRLYDGARRVLWELATQPIYKDNMIVAVASSSLEPSYSYACLDAIEVAPNGITMRDLIQ